METQARFTLYKYDSCPFCHMVRSFLADRGWDIPTRDTLRDPSAAQELLAGGGRSTVPCLKIVEPGEDGAASRVHWMYESRDIMSYLSQELGQAS